MREVFVLSDAIVSPLGSSTEENFAALAAGASGVRLQERPDMSATPFYASLFDVRPAFDDLVYDASLSALAASGLAAADPRLAFIVCSTKGNISRLETGESSPDAFSLPASAAVVASRLGVVAEPVVVSHACISGLQGMITAMRLIQAGLYDHALVCGADLITRFILSGFQSFQAVSPEPCRPFDADRQGVTLGEAAAAMVLSAHPSSIRLAGGAVSNDANHISGPSRTGEELYMAIKKVLNGSPVDFISAHGTATLYNDDMEARAINLAGLADVPLNSLKGFYGHTLGAAGLLESIISVQSLRENLILPTPGYRRPGTVLPVNVASALLSLPVRRCLKTASGFGGCNAAVLLEKL